MQHPQSPYGSRLREFHARHGITPDRRPQPHRLKLLPPAGGPPRRMSILRAVILGVAASIAFVAWILFCVLVLGVGEITGSQGAPSSSVAP